jgi:hypothetical protein
MQNYKVKEGAMQNCPVFVEGKECGLPLAQVDREAEKIARYDLATYQCGLGHRSYFLHEPLERVLRSIRKTSG